MELLIEIGVEELPAIPFLKEVVNIRPKWEKVLQYYNLSSEFEFFYTPRRIVLFHKNFSAQQPDNQVITTGAPKAVAFQDGKWSKAALSFAQKCGIKESDLCFENIEGKEVLYHKSIKKGSPSKELLAQMIEAFLQSLNFGKSMRWGRGEFDFIRPIRNIICLLDNQNVDMKIYGVSSRAAFLSHRKFGYELVEFKSCKEYFVKLNQNGIILSSKDRRDKVLSEFKNIEEKHKINIEIDENLLDEVIAITEYPTALLGEFDRAFLKVPKEVIITSMKENQRYFPVFKDENLSNHFVVVSNAITEDDALIIKGNEKVLKARLSDAMFFYNSDLKSEFSPEKLKNIVYMKELGSVYDKVERELKVAIKTAEMFHEKLLLEFGGKNYMNDLKTAIMLSKADLTTAMVGEFGELQGVMGSYYAKENGQSKFVVRAIGEQYLPSGEKSALPTGIFSSVIAMSIKLDTLMGLFSIDKIPSGNKDPYALRRAASGLIKIILNYNLNYNLNSAIGEISDNYKNFDHIKLLNFIKDRLYTMYSANQSVIKACINSGESDILKLDNAINALDEISRASNFKENFVTFKRLANIIKDEKINKVDEALLKEEAEIALYEAFNKVDLSNLDCKTYLNSLFVLKDKIDDFFQNVMINVQNKELRTNRINLIGKIYQAFLKVADIKEISF